MPKDQEIWDSPYQTETPEESREIADDLGLDGVHRHDTPGEDVWMPGEDHSELREAVGPRAPRVPSADHESQRTATNSSQRNTMPFGNKNAEDILGMDSDSPMTMDLDTGGGMTTPEVADGEADAGSAEDAMSVRLAPDSKGLRTDMDSEELQFGSDDSDDFI